jgi:hypothetical protein
VWQALHFAAAARGKLRELRRLMVLGGSGGGVVPLVRQLLHKVQLQVGGRAPPVMFHLLYIMTIRHLLLQSLVLET